MIGDWWERWWAWVTGRSVRIVTDDEPGYRLTSVGGSPGNALRGYRDRMDRRLAGLVVLVLVLVTATALPGFSGRRVAGVPSAKNFPDPPSVGDCVLSPLDGAVSNSGSRTPEIDVTAVTWGRCTGQVFGEIVATGSADSGLTNPGSTNASSERRAGRCSRSVAAFAGLDPTSPRPTIPGAPRFEHISWAPTLGFDPYRVVPGEEERAAGRTWSRCLVAPIVHRSYQGTLAQAFQTGQMPGEFGLCWGGTDLDLAIDLIRCDEPHAAELLATAFVDDRSLVTRDDYQRTCGQMAALIMRTDAPIAGGELTAVIDPVTSDGQSLPTSPQTVGCFVASADERLLDQTVIALADRPVPFAA